MGLLDAIDKLLEPLTTKIFSTSFGKSIKPLNDDDLFADEPDTSGNLLYADIPGNISHRAWEENQKNMFSDD
jgi:hypothetical protein